MGGLLNRTSILGKHTASMIEVMMILMMMILMMMDDDETCGDENYKHALFCSSIC